MPGTGQVGSQNGAQGSSAEHREFKIRTGLTHRISMPQSKEYLQYVLEQLDSLRGVVSRRMFGGAGLYQDDVFFGLLFRDTLYFKVNDTNRPDYESRGMGRFQPYPDKPYLSFTYYEVPIDILEDREELTSWARRSIAAALAIAAEKRVTRKPRTVGKRSTAGKQATAKKKARARR
jgi:DNA transformation protein